MTALLALAAARRWLGNALGSVPLWAWEALAAVVALFAVWHWHAVTVRHATHAGVLAGMDAQLAADERAVTRAFIAATEKQDAIIAKATTAQAIISKGSTDAIAIVDDAAARALAGFVRQHSAPAAAPGGPGSHAADTVSRAADGADGAAALQPGVVAVEADAVADAARVAGRLSALQAWVDAQGKAWPQ